MKKKVGIVTLHYSFIYGGLLQCFALYQALEKLGLEVYVIDYRPKRSRLFQIALNCLKPHSQIRSAELLENHFSRFERIYKGFIKIVNVTIIGIKNRRFIKAHLQTTPPYYSPEDLEASPPQADSFICGSDQIWNTVMPFEPQEIRPYFLSFAKNTPKIAYAPSLGGAPFKEIYKKDIQRFLADFTFLSARETLVIKECRDCAYAGEIPLVLDPALLLNAEDYQAIMRPPQNQPTPYLATFFRQAKSNDLFDCIKDFNARQSRPWIDMSFDYASRPDQYEFNRGPINWLQRIQGAQLLITDSFHATAYALLFKTDFYVISLSRGKKGSNNRLQELLSKVGLSHRIRSSKELLDNPQQAFSAPPIDWEKVSEALQIERERSLDFLRKALK